jgi:type I restriction enzyme M protein
LLKKLADKFVELNKKKKLHADLYYLDKGKFRFIIDSDYSKDIEAVAKSVDNALITENDYNLSVSSYVEAKETRQETDIKELNERIRKIVARENELRAEIDEIIKELEEQV